MILLLGLPQGYQDTRSKYIYREDIGHTPIGFLISASSHESLSIDSEGQVLLLTLILLVPLILLSPPPEEPLSSTNVWLWDSASAPISC